MIFVTVGSQKFQFDRLIKWLDELIERKLIEEEVFAQIGYSEYIPQNFNYKRFLNQEEFKNKMESSTLIITHAGTGAIIKALKMEKKIIAVPRDKKYGEHVDNHQYEISDSFVKSGYILEAKDFDEMIHSIKNLDSFYPKKYISNTTKYIDYISNYIEEI